MKIFCEDITIFDDVSVRRQLMKLFLRVAEGQHTLIVGDAERLMESSFFRSSGDLDREEWEEIVRRALAAYDMENRAEEPGERPRGLHVSVGKTRSPRSSSCRFGLTAGEVGDWAEQPLRVLMENERDWALLEAAARAFNLSSIEGAFLRRWLVVDGRGGCGEVLNSLRRRAEADRLFAFIDQDPDPMTHARSSTSRRIEAECRRDPLVPFHVTRKREIENYVPRAILELHVFAGMSRSATRAKRPRSGRGTRACWSGSTSPSRRRTQMT